MLARYWPPTSATSTPIVHIRAGTNGRPTTTRAWSCRSTRPYGDNVSSAAYSTNTNEQPDHNYKRAGHGQRGVLARDRVDGQTGWQWARLVKKSVTPRTQS